MTFLVVAMLFSFVGFAQELIYEGIAIADLKWFAKLGFSEPAQDVAWEHVVSHIAAAGIKFVFITITVVAYITLPHDAPLTPGRVVTSTLFVVAVLGLNVLSAWRQLRRKRLSEREMKVLGP